MNTPSPTPVVIVVHAADGAPAWMTVSAFVISIVTAVVGAAWALWRFVLSRPRIIVTTSTYPNFMGVDIPFTSRDYVYRITAANRGEQSTKVHAVVIEMDNGGIKITAQPILGLSDAFEAPLAAHDQLEWVFALATFRDPNYPLVKQDPPTVRVTPVIKWGPNRITRGASRDLRIDEPLQLDLPMPGGTITIGPPDSTATDPPVS